MSNGPADQYRRASALFKIDGQYWPSIKIHDSDEFDRAKQAVIDNLEKDLAVIKATRVDTFMRYKRGL